MRRTLVSRKARKRRIAENAEMNGENYYNRQIVVKVDVPPIGSTTPDQKAAEITAAPTAGPRLLPTNDDGYLRNPSPNSDPPPGTAGYPRPPPGSDGFAISQDPYGPPPSVRSDPNLRTQFSDTSMRSNRSDGPVYPPRARGGYPPRGRGRPYGGPRGFPPGGDSRGGHRFGPPRRARGGPPPGYPPRNRGYTPNGYAGYGPGPGFGARDNPMMNNGNPRDRDIELQASSGAARLASGKTGNITGPDFEPRGAENPKSPTSVYSMDASYVPPRSNWNPQEYPIRELPTEQIPPISPLGPNTQPRDMTRSPPALRPHPPSSYYEDLEPRFALPITGVESTDVPSALVPGSSGEPLTRSSYDDFPVGPRSPAASETSHFTSISQRGINPKWRPPESETPKAKLQQRQDVLLNSNPDFALPAGRVRANTVAGGRMPPPPPMPTIPGTPTGIRNEGKFQF
ncbi:predicted protein [Uncinocarpus reesii 1704]|uniref:Uncharacterized protein n=1 Tax=Uncinocarpus reesii (strain UAMH 1704) TaxID=336963 RepID=C4JWS8_UNCRE|nr:uncharacterized protein UREG_06101 [Uncinocarpus reesii 1704]EEP81236.1 predicted protein [Uncinocarpus reesii 1704]